MAKQTESPVEEIVKAIRDKKGFNVLVLDVQDVSTLTSYFVIAEGRVERHLKAICNEIIERLGKLGRKPYHLEGDNGDEWVVLDYGDIIIHLFKPEVREKYSLEQMWHDSKIVDYPCMEEPLSGDNDEFF